MAKLPEQEYDVFDATIPGQSLTDEPGRWPWDNPPKYPRFEDALNVAMTRMFNENGIEKIAAMLDAGIPAEGIARTIVFAGFMEGQYTPDVGLMMTQTVFEAVVTIGQMASVKDMKITLRNKDTEDLQFKSDMRNAKFIRSIVQRTEKDFESIAEQEDKKEEPKGLMARPEPVDIKNQVKEEDMEDEE